MSNHTHDTTSDQKLADGVFVNEIVRIESSEQLADLLADATARNQTAIPFGGRRSLATGNPADSARWGLDITGLRGIIAYEPADLTLSVRAGTSLAEIQHVLAEAGQELPIDIPHPDETTIGGLVATGFAGPRRLRSGSLRDLLIGCEFVRGDGLQAKAGGMVVKNVSGFEIPRFLHGSWGALAVLTSVNLKVTPMARADGTLLGGFASIGDAISAAQALNAAEASIEACVVTSDGDGVRLAARAVGRDGAVSAMLDSFARCLGSESERLESATSRTYWQDLASQYAEDSSSVIVAMSIRPRDIQSLAHRLNEAGSRFGARTQVSPGIGSLRIVIPYDEVHSSRCLAEIIGVAMELDVPYVLESAPLSLRSTVPTWGVEPEGIDVMRSVKRQFDPSNVLNPGRLFL